METTTREKTSTRRGMGTESSYTTAMERGYTTDDVHVILSPELRKRYDGTTTFRIDLGDQSLDGLAIGGALGGIVLGATFAILVLSTPIVIPLFGIVAIGPEAAGLIGVGLGSVIGAVFGAIIGTFFTEEHVTVLHQDHLTTQGRPLIAGEENDELVEDWKKFKERDYT